MTSTPTGDTLINDVLNGGYNVQPVPCVPLLNSPVTDKIIKIYDNGNIKIDILFTLGYTFYIITLSLFNSMDMWRFLYFKSNIKKIFDISFYITFHIMWVYNYSFLLSTLSF